jgi:hypothetical protein
MPLLRTVKRISTVLSLGLHSLLKQSNRPNTIHNLSLTSINIIVVYLGQANDSQMQCPVCGPFGWIMQINAPAYVGQQMPGHSLMFFFVCVCFKTVAIVFAI